MSGAQQLRRLALAFLRVVLGRIDIHEVHDVVQRDGLDLDADVAIVLHLLDRVVEELDVASCALK